MRSITFRSVILILLLCAGCGPGGPEIAKVKGKVTLDGKPLPNAAVIFIPENGRPAGGRTDSEGNYYVSFTEGRYGAIPGKSTVRITTLSEGGQAEDGTNIAGSAELVPDQYNTQTTLTFDVKPDTENIANFDLKSKKN